MLIPLEYFLMGYGFYRQALSVSPRSPLSPSCISPELLSPESMGLKLKPIKTRITMKVWNKIREVCGECLGNREVVICLRLIEDDKLSVVDRKSFVRQKPDNFHSFIHNHE